MQVTNWSNKFNNPEPKIKPIPNNKKRHPALINGKSCTVFLTEEEIKKLDGEPFVQNY